MTANVSGDLHQHVFEGTEKLLEIWFFSDYTFVNPKMEPDLRDIPSKDIQEILDLAKCEIIKKSFNDYQIAYVLSESSLFITRDRIILKTCGKTTLLNTVGLVTKLAYQLGFSKHVLYYSRRSYLYPELQPAPHNDFESELRVLKKFCEYGGGYTFGRLDGDCWLNKNAMSLTCAIPFPLYPQHGIHLRLHEHFYCGQSHKYNVDEPPGQTIEIIMRGLKSRKMNIFHSANVNSTDEATKRSGIASLFPNGRLSSYLFEPCGYSVNGLMEKDEYFTIHVTPEPEFSYASFETNVALPCYRKLVLKVLEVFEPESFIFTFIAEAGAPTYGAHASFEKASRLPNYVRNELHTAVMACGRKLTFAEFIHESTSD